MLPSEPSNAFWPQKIDACWVPFQQILCKIATPQLLQEDCIPYSITPECNAIVNAYTDEKRYSY